MGYPRSGTTALRRLLSAHPALCILPETMVFRFATRAAPKGLLTAKNVDAVLRAIPDRERPIFDPEHFRAAALAQLPLTQAEGIGLLFHTAPLAHAAPAVRLGHKFPNDSPLMPRLARWYPQAKFVHIIRRPHDAIASLFSHNLQGRARTPAIAAWHWRSYDRLLRRTGKELGLERYHALQLEDLKADPEKALTALCRFLALDPRYIPEMMSTPRSGVPTLADLAEAARPHMRKSHMPFTPEAQNGREAALSQNALRRIDALCAGEMAHHGYMPASEQPAHRVERLGLAVLAAALEVTWSSLRMYRRFKGEP